jgi:hypothetical protein
MTNQDALIKVLEETWEVVATYWVYVKGREPNQIDGLVGHFGHTVVKWIKEKDAARAAVASKAPEMARIIMALVHAAENGRADNGAIFVGDETIADARALLAAVREADDD